MSTEPAPSPTTPGPLPGANLPPVPAAPAPRHPPQRRRRGWLAQMLGGGGADDQVTVYHHAALFYWWPVWLLGFIFAIYSYFDAKHLAIVPVGTEAVETVTIERDGQKQTRHALILPEGKQLVRRGDGAGGKEIFQPQIYVTSHRGVGTAFTVVLLLVIAMTNISVRGLWSLLVVIVIFMMTIIFYLAGWWGTIFHHMGQFSVFLNMGGYLVISSVLFVLWLLSVFFFDRQTYMIFSPGQLRVRLVIGGEETVYDTSGMVVQRQRNDMFRHWVLGFGSGDLVVRPAGIGHPLELDNVLNVSNVVRRIEQLIKEKVVVRGVSSDH